MSDLLQGKRIIEISRLAEMSVRPTPEDWTAIIPAAGRGSRLGYDKPKLLFPVAGRTILEWLVDELSPLCARFVFVLSPDGAPLIIPELERLLPRRWSVALQTEPLGMGDAVSRAAGHVTSRCSLVVWGDQIGVRASTIRACMNAHAMRNNAASTCPTVWRDRPYIHFERDASGRITAIQQAREGDELPSRGESDCGLFLFDTEQLFEAVDKMRSSSEAWGRKTKELNFLPVLPFMDNEVGRVCCVRISDVEQSAGINTSADALAVSATLLARSRQEVPE